jgi:hypothetical protein
VDFGTQGVTLEKLLRSGDNERQLKYTLNLVYYKIDRWENANYMSANSNLDSENILNYIDNISQLESSSFEGLINSVSSEVDLASQLLDNNTHANASMYDSLSWYYAHESLYYYRSGQIEKSHNSIIQSANYHQKCSNIWVTEERLKGEVFHDIWDEHDRAIKKIKEIIF